MQKPNFDRFDGVGNTFEAAAGFFQEVARVLLRYQMEWTGVVYEIEGGVATSFKVKPDPTKPAIDNEYSCCYIYPANRRVGNARKFVKDIVGKNGKTISLHSISHFSTLIKSMDANAKVVLNSNDTETVILSSYRFIEQVYAFKKASRSGLWYMNHIDEGLYILDRLNGLGLGSPDPTDKAAFASHAALQSDEDIKYNYGPWISKMTNSNRLATKVFEYRAIANDYLSNKVISSPSEIKLSPLEGVNMMLMADKIQNFKDLMLHNREHPRFEQLHQYFMNWFTALKVPLEVVGTLSLELSSVHSLYLQALKTGPVK